MGCFATRSRVWARARRGALCAAAYELLKGRAASAELLDSQEGSQKRTGALESSAHLEGPAWNGERGGYAGSCEMLQWAPVCGPRWKFQVEVRGGCVATAGCRVAAHLRRANRWGNSIQLWLFKSALQAVFALQVFFDLMFDGAWRCFYT